MMCLDTSGATVLTLGEWLDGIYAGDLATAFTEYTGMDTYLYRIDKDKC